MINYPSPENPPNVSRASEPMGSLFTGCTRTNCTKNVGVHVTRTHVMCYDPQSIDVVICSRLRRHQIRRRLTRAVNNTIIDAQHQHVCRLSHRYVPPTITETAAQLNGRPEHFSHGSEQQGVNKTLPKNLGRHNYRMVKGTGSKFENLLKEEGRISSYATDQHWIIRISYIW